MNSMTLKALLTVLLFCAGLASSFAEQEVQVAQLHPELRMERQNRQNRQERRSDQRILSKKSRRQAEKRSDRYQQRLKKHHKRIERHKRRPKYGVVINTLPMGYHRGLNRRHHDHYYRGGLFYRYSGGHYLSVRPPYGMIVATLPLGYLTLQFGTGFYARYNDVYYRPVPRGYMVVEPPLSAPPAPQPNIGAVPANAVGTVTVSIEVLNVRSGPSRLHPVADHVYSGDQLYVLGQAPDWYYVKLPQGGFGWVWAEFAVGALRP